MTSTTARAANSKRYRWIFLALAVAVVAVAAVVLRLVIQDDERGPKPTVGTMLSGHPHPFDDEKTVTGSSFDSANKGEATAEIYSNRFAELAAKLGLSYGEIDDGSWLAGIEGNDVQDNRAETRPLLQEVLDDAVKRGDISYVDRERILYAFDLGLIDAPVVLPAEPRQ